MQALIFRCLILWGKGDFEIVRLRDAQATQLNWFPLIVCNHPVLGPGSIANQFTNLKIFIFNISLAQTLKFYFNSFILPVSKGCLLTAWTSWWWVYYICLTERRLHVAPHWTVNPHLLKNACNGFRYYGSINQPYSCIIHCFTPSLLD